MGSKRRRTRESLPERELRALARLKASLMPFTKLRQTMPLQYVLAFLLVALEEGLGVSEYAERAGVAISVMSRHLLDIGERNRRMQEGFGLVTYRPHPQELRRHEYFLTPKGRALAHEIFSNMAR